MRRALFVAVLAMGCSKPLALPSQPVSAPPASTPPATAQGSPADPNRDHDRYQMPRDPRGGYLNPSEPPPQPRDTTPPDREPPPPFDPDATDDPLPSPPPPAPQCKRHEIEVKRCITGGMPRQGPNGLEARTSCSTRCQTTPPTHKRCRKIDARHYECRSFAP